MMTINPHLHRCHFMRSIVQKTYVTSYHMVSDVTIRAFFLSITVSNGYGSRWISDIDITIVLRLLILVWVVLWSSGILSVL